MRHIHAILQLEALQMMKATMMKQNQARIQSAIQREQMSAVETSQARTVQDSVQQQVLLISISI